MTETAQKDELHAYLRTARKAVVWKLDGLSEYDVRRPMVPTGTNLLGLVKHLTGIEAGYFGDTFDRPFGEPLACMRADAEPNADMWATADESPDQIIDLYDRACAHSDTTIESLSLDSVGQVPWWRAQSRTVTLHKILVHVIAETNRHAGHADIVRELIDGAAGVRPGNDNLPDVDPEWWARYRDRLETVARTAGRG